MHMNRLAVFALLVLGLPLGAASAAVITVTTDLDTNAADGDCSIREAIEAANTDTAVQECSAGSGEDRIQFALPEPATIRLTDHLPAIDDRLRISGPGRDLLQIDGINAFRIIDAEGDPFENLVIIEDLTLTRGRTTPTGFQLGGAALVHEGVTAIFRRVDFLANSSFNGGGAVGILGSVTRRSFLVLEDCLLMGNEAQGAVGGGAVVASENVELLVTGTTFAMNLASHDNGRGGAVHCARCSAHFERVTVSDNEAMELGGGIYAASGPVFETEIVLRSSTVVGNRAGAGSTDGGGGGIGISQPFADPIFLTLENTVLGKNADLDATPPLHPDLGCSPMTTLAASGSSFIAINQGCETLFPEGNPNGDGNFVGSFASPLPPQLGALGDHGGPTPVHLPLLTPLSPLLDQGSCPEESIDQRSYGNGTGGARAVDLPGVANGSGGACDIGAAELQAVPALPPLVFGDGFESGTFLFWQNVVD